ncbi:hypothetical protein C7402_12460 [Paraburkholderia unamae]|uniref:Uncharacterized protein n=1 Tax=Paraburkholderia unamae TaxID=219649 RepID=A0ABX5KB74_9BURK|nr:hypothetical protein C7402_12460 [Paraburkholderia unamae]
MLHSSERQFHFFAAKLSASHWLNVRNNHVIHRDSNKFVRQAT